MDKCSCDEHVKNYLFVFEKTVITPHLKPTGAHMFRTGSRYDRNNHLIREAIDNRKRISICSDFPIIFLFFKCRWPVGMGYVDKWLYPKEVLQFTGEGHSGDMDLSNGNKAIQNHRHDGRKLYLFEMVSNGKYECLGRFEYIKHEIIESEDIQNGNRYEIVFLLGKLM
jgi:hypothetical protein